MLSSVFNLTSAVYMRNCHVLLTWRTTHTAYIVTLYSMSSLASVENVRNCNVLLQFELRHEQSCGLAHTIFRLV